MAKKDKDPTPNPASIQNREIIQRLNFIYQASVYLTNLSQDVPSTDANPTGSDAHQTRTGDKEERRAYRRRIRTTNDLARAYVDTMTTVGKKTTVKMYVCARSIQLNGRRYSRDPSIKRTLCKACNNILVPGVSVHVRVKRESPMCCASLLGWVGG